MPQHIGCASLNCQNTISWRRPFLHRQLSEPVSSVSLRSGRDGLAQDRKNEARMGNILCSVSECCRDSDARTFCRLHYKRCRRHGDPSVVVKTTPKGDVKQYFLDVVLPYEEEHCLLWPYSRFPNGYAQLHGFGQSTIASRIACEAVNGSPPTPSHEAAHSCGKGHLGCVNPKHLSWKTRSENQKDRIIHGTFGRGEGNGYSKITEEIALSIKSMKGRATQKEIAKLHGTTRSIVSHIFVGESWSWL